MNNTARVLVAALVIVLLAIGAYWALSQRIQAPGTGEETTEEAAPVSSTLPSGSNTSDASLDQDTAAIDAQLNAFASDNSNINAGMNDAQSVQSSL